MSDRYRIRFAALLLILLQWPASGQSRHAHWVSARFSIRPPVKIVSYSNAGYRLVSTPDGTVQVEVDSSPLRIATGFPVSIRDVEASEVLRKAKQIHLPAPVRGQGRKLTVTATGYVQAVRRVLTWIASRFSYRKTETGPLAGNCNTAADTAVALLAEAGIPARVVDGVVMEKNRRVLSGAALHRWIEIYYPGIGWLFSDPLASLHYVPPTYIVIHDLTPENLVGTTIICTKPYRPHDAVGILKHRSMTERINLFRFR